jgi:hypothetical protein
VRVTRTIGREIASRAGPPGQTRRVKAKTGGRGSVRPERGRGSGWLPQLPCLLSPSLVLLLFRPRSLSLFPFCICCCCGSRFSLFLLQIIILAHTGPPLSLLASTQTNALFFSSLFSPSTASAACARVFAGAPFSFTQPVLGRSCSRPGEFRVERCSLRRK